MKKTTATTKTNKFAAAAEAKAEAFAAAIVSVVDQVSIIDLENLDVEGMEIITQANGEAEQIATGHRLYNECMKALGYLKDTSPEYENNKRSLNDKIRFHESESEKYQRYADEELAKYVQSQFQEWLVLPKNKDIAAAYDNMVNAPHSFKPGRIDELKAQFLKVTKAIRQAVLAKSEPGDRFEPYWSNVEKSERQGDLKIEATTQLSELISARDAVGKEATEKGRESNRIFRELGMHEFARYKENKK